MSLIKPDTFTLYLPESVEGLEKTIEDDSTPNNVLFSFGANTSSLAYKLFRFYLYKRKYSHISGPPTEGYSLVP